MISCLIYKTVLTKPFICCRFSLPAGLVKGLFFPLNPWLLCFWLLLRWWWNNNTPQVMFETTVSALTTPDCVSVCYSTYCIHGVCAYAYLSTIRSSVRLRRQSVRPFSPSSTSCWQEGQGNNMGGGAVSFRLRPGYVPHTGRRMQVKRRGNERERDMDGDIEEKKVSVCPMEDWHGVMEAVNEGIKRDCWKKVKSRTLGCPSHTHINKYKQRYTVDIDSKSLHIYI